jgi:hypothetical protein
MRAPRSESSLAEARPAPPDAEPRAWARQEMVAPLPARPEPPEQAPQEPQPPEPQEPQPPEPEPQEQASRVAPLWALSALPDGPPPAWEPRVRQQARARARRARARRARARRESPQVPPEPLWPELLEPELLERDAPVDAAPVPGRAPRAAWPEARMVRLPVAAPRGAQESSSSESESTARDGRWPAAGAGPPEGVGSARVSPRVRAWRRPDGSPARVWLLSQERERMRASVRESLLRGEFVRRPLAREPAIEGALVQESRARRRRTLRRSPPSQAPQPPVPARTDDGESASARRLRSRRRSGAPSTGSRCPRPRNWSESSFRSRQVRAASRESLPA